MRWWTLALLTVSVPWACGDSKKASDDGGGAGGKAGAAGRGGSAGSTSGSAGQATTGGASGSGGTSGAAGGSAASGGSSGANASGGAGAGGSGIANAGGTSAAGAGEAGAAGEAGVAGEAGAPSDRPHAESVDVGGYHACAVLERGTVLCWGSDSDGQIGDGSIGGDHLAPYAVPITDVTQVSLGSTHTCALEHAGTVKCWGDNLSGALGNGLDDNVDRPRPVDVVGITDAVAIAAGSLHTCALLSGGGVKCWGRDAEGQLGNGTDGEEDQSTPVDVSGISDAVGIASGGRHSCAIIDGGTVKCWGFDLHGQIGDGAPQGDKRAPVDVVGLTGVVALDAGESHTCAIRSNGDLMCWGWDARGQLGDGDDDEADELTPILIPLASDPTSIGLGVTWTCAVLTGGTLQCWGWDREGSLGNGAAVTADQLSPATVPDLTSVVAVSAGAYDTCAVTSDDRVHCWGRDTEGEVGDGDDGQAIQDVPTLVQGF